MKSNSAATGQPLTASRCADLGLLEFDDGGMADEIFPASRDQYRWLAVSHSDGRCCQLQTPHDGAHARIRSDPPIRCTPLYPDVSRHAPKLVPGARKADGCDQREDLDQPCGKQWEVSRR